MAEKFNTQVRLVHIEDLGFSFERPQSTLPDTPTLDNYKVRTNVAIGIDPIKNLIRIRMKFILAYKDDNIDDLEGRMPIMVYEGAITYEFKELSVDINEEKKQVAVPQELINYLATTSYSTFRGVIYSKCSSTPLRSVYIPMAPPSHIENMMKSILAEQ